MKKFIILLAIVSLLGCSNDTIPVAIIPPPPKQTESALPNVIKLESEVDNTVDSNKKIGDKINESKIIINEQNISILEALNQAEKIKEKALAKVAITELEASNLIAELKKVQTRNLFLEKQNQELTKLKEDQEKILNIIKNTLDKTREQVSDKENEATELRKQNIYLSQNLTAKNEESEKLKATLQKEKEISASAKVYKHWIITLVSVFIGWLILKNILMIYFPSIKFRV